MELRRLHRPLWFSPTRLLEHPRQDSLAWTLAAAMSPRAAANRPMLRQWTVWIYRLWKNHLRDRSTDHWSPPWRHSTRREGLWRHRPASRLRPIKPRRKVLGDLLPRTTARLPPDYICQYRLRISRQSNQNRFFSRARATTSPYREWRISHQCWVQQVVGWTWLIGACGRCRRRRQSCWTSRTDWI